MSDGISPRLTAWRRTAALVLFCLVAGVHGRAQTCPGSVGYEDFGQHNQLINDIAASGHFAFTADHYGLTVYDASDPSHPARTAELLLESSATSIALAGDVAYLVARPGLVIVDVGDPSHPAPLSTLDLSDLSDSVFAVAVSGTVACLGTNSTDSNSLYVVDVSDPAHPRLLGSRATSSGVVDIAMSGSFAYVSEGASGIEVFDLSDPAHPAPVASFNEGSFYLKSTVKGNRLYVASPTDGLVIFDVSDPRNLRLLGNTPGSSSDVAVSGTLAFIPDFESGLLVVDVSDPAHPTVLGACEDAPESVAVGVSGNLVYLGGLLGLGIVDVATPWAPVFDGFLDTSGSAMGVAISGETALVADRWAGLQLVDLRDPAHPVVVGSYDSGEMVTRVAVAGSTGFLAVSPHTLELVDLNDPAHPSHLGSYEMPSGVDDVAVSGHTAYVADWAGGLVILDVSDPAHPQLLGSSDAPERARAVAVSGNIVYVADDSYGLRILDVSDPSQPRLLGSYEIEGGARDVAVTGTTLLLDTSESGLLILDVSDPAHPASIAGVPDAGPALMVMGSTALVAGSSLEVLDLRDPAHPEVVATVETMRYVTDTAVEPGGSHVWLAEGAFLEGIDLGCPTCAGLSVSAEPPVIAAGGAQSTITVTLTDPFGGPQPGQSVTGTTTLGTLSPFTDRGDGTYTAVLTSGETSGTATVSVAVNGTACGATATVQITGGGGGGTVWIPVAVHGGGLHGSAWRTALGILATGSSADTVAVSFEGEGGTVERTLEVAPGEQHILSDVVEWLGTSGAGALRVTGSQPFVLTSRTYSELGPGENCFPGGTLGQFLAASNHSPSLAAGESAWLVQLAENQRLRTNIALTDTGSHAASARITLYRGDGSEVGGFTVTLEPGEWHQETRPFANRFGLTGLDSGYARVEVLSGAGILGYASVVDNVTNDPTTIPLIRSSGGLAATQWIAVASHASGAHGSAWRTDLGVLNPGQESAVVTLSAAGSSTQVTVPSGYQVVLGDVLTRLGLSGSAALEVSSSAPVAVSSRTYTENPADAACWAGGTLGQYLPGSALDTVLSEGTEARLAQLTENGRYRTNIAFTNTGSEPATVRVTLYDGHGNEVGSYQVELQPGEWRQENRPYAERFGADDVEAGWAEVQVLSGAGILGYASVVDNVTNDPTTIPLALP